MTNETLTCLGALITLVEALTSAQEIVLDDLEVMEWEWINPVEEAGQLLRMQVSDDGSVFFFADALLSLQCVDDGAFVLPDEYGNVCRLEIA